MVFKTNGRQQMFTEAGREQQIGCSGMQASLIIRCPTRPTGWQQRKPAKIRVFRYCAVQCAAAGITVQDILQKRERFFDGENRMIPVLANERVAGEPANQVF